MAILCHFEFPWIKKIFELLLTRKANGTTFFKKKFVTNNLSQFPSIPDSPHVATTFRIIQPTMTYVLAFMISDFSKIQSNETSIIQNVYAPPNKINDMYFALEASVKTMAVFEEYLGVPYSLAKFDQVGLPNFAPEATENWGKINKSNSIIHNSRETSMKTLF